MMRLPVLMAALLLVPLEPADAQRLSTQQLTTEQRSVLSPGTRIRLVAPTLGRDPIVGTITQARLDTIVVDTSDTWRQRRVLMPAPILVEEFRSVSLPLEEVDSVQVSQGRSRAMGMLQGAIKGGLIAGAYLGLTALSRSQSPTIGKFANGFGTGLVLGGTIGVPVGYLLGGSERWMTVPLPRQFRRPSPGTIVRRDSVAVP